MSVAAPRVLRRAGSYGSAIVRGIRPRYALVHAAARLVPPFTAGPVIARLYRFAGFRIGRGTSILGPLDIVSGAAFEENLVVGEDALISTNVTINVDALVRIEDGASISPFVRIYTANHATGPSSRRMAPHAVGVPVTIEEGAWIRLGATILPGVTVGRGSIVGAGSVVSTDVPPNTLVQGNPAAVVRTLAED